MTFCRQGHTLVDNEAEAGWDQLVPGTFFELIVSAVTYFGIVDEYTPPTATTLICRLYSDAPRTILVTTPIPLAAPYVIQNFVDYNWTARDVELLVSKDIGTWTSPPVVVRDEFGFWTGSWTATPMTDQTVQFNFDGTYQLFLATADQPIGIAIAGAGLAPGTYEYCIVPVDGAARLGAGSTKVTVVLAAPGDIQLDWLANNQVTDWNIYGRTTAGFGLITTLPGGTITFVDDGSLPPNVGFQPPLFEDPAWVVAAPDKQISLTDGGIQLDGFGNEVAVEKRDDGIVLSDATNAGTMQLTNSGETFDIDNLESTSSVAIEAVIDPNLFTNDTGPVEDLPPKVDIVAQHIFIDSDGFKRIVSVDETTDRIITVIINTTTNIVTTIITDIAGTELGQGTMTLAEFLADLPNGIPDVGSMATRVTYSNFQLQSDGVIIGTKTIELNTYDVVVTTPPVGVTSILLINSHTDIFSFDPEYLFSFDGGATWPTSYGLASKVTLYPNAFFHGSLSTGYGEGWLVVALRQVTGGNNFGFVWTNDINAAVWAFQDGSGRNGAGDSQDFDTFLFGWNFAYRAAIVKMANGKIVYYHEPYAISTADSEHIQFFFPATGVFYSGTEVGLSFNNLISHALWEQKNLYIFVQSNDELYTMDFGTSEIAPVSNKQLRTTLANTNNIKIHISPNKVIITYDDGANALAATTTDGISWTIDIPLGLIASANEVYNMISGHESYNKAIGKWISQNTAGDILSSPASDGFTWTVELAAPSREDNAIGQGLDNAGVSSKRSGYPILTDGNKIMFPGPEEGGFVTDWGNLTRMDTDFTNVQSTGLPVPALAPDYNAANSDIRTAIASVAVPESTIFANIRPYIPQRLVRAPRDVVPNMPIPFRARDTSGPIYDSVRTYSRRTPQGFTIDVTITSFARGGTGNAIRQRVEDGVRITENIVYERTPNLPPKVPSRIPYGFPTPK